MHPCIRRRLRASARPPSPFVSYKTDERHPHSCPLRRRGTGTTSTSSARHLPPPSPYSPPLSLSLSVLAGVLDVSGAAVRGGGGGAGWQELMRSCWRRTSLGRPRQTDERTDGGRATTGNFVFAPAEICLSMIARRPLASSRRGRCADGFLAPSPDVRGRNLSDARLSTAATDIFARITATARLPT